MSKFNWRNGFAIGLIFGIGLAVLLLLTLESLSPPISYISEPPTDCGTAGNDCANDNESMPDWWYWPRRLFAFEDTVAQWIMMFFTVIAAFFLWRTLTVTQVMANDARNIGNMQNRAWLKCGLSIPSGLLASENSLPFGMEISAENLGNSPATEVLTDVFLFQNFEHNDELKIIDLKDDLIRKVETGFQRTNVILPREKSVKARAEVVQIDRKAVVPFVGGVQPSACVVAVYKTTGKEGWCCTATIFDLFIRSEDGVGLGCLFPVDGKPISGEKINVVMRRNAIGT